MRCVRYAAGTRCANSSLEQRRTVARAAACELPRVNSSPHPRAAGRAEEHELGCFVERVVGAVPEPQLRLLEQQRCRSESAARPSPDRGARQRGRRRAGRWTRVHDRRAIIRATTGIDVPNISDRARSHCRHCSRRAGICRRAGWSQRSAPVRGHCTRDAAHAAAAAAAARARRTRTPPFDAERLRGAGASCSSASPVSGRLPDHDGALAQTRKLLADLPEQSCARRSS